MLERLRVRDLALLEDVEIELGPGLIVVTGESGAGKTLLLRAIELVFGARATGEVVRVGRAQARIEVTLRVDGGILAEDALSLGFSGGTLLVQRDIPKAGRGRALVEGRGVPLTVLARLGQNALRQQGQHAALELVRPEAHVGLLDTAAGLLDIKRKFNEGFEGVQRVIGRIELLARGRDELERRCEILRFDVEELTRLGVDEPDAIESLRAERERLRHMDRLRRAAEEALAEIDGAEAPALARIERQARRLADVATLDAELAAAAELLAECVAPLREAARLLQGFGDPIEDAAARLDGLEERLAQLERLGRKHRVNDLVDLCEVRRRLAEDLEAATGASSDPEALEGDLAKAAETAWLACEQLEAARRRGAAALESSVSSELSRLGMGDARFQVGFEPIRADTTAGPRAVLVRHGRRLEASGSHAVEFHLEANAGEGALPLARFASGGELSRVMLALASLPRARDGATLVLDEVDAGIGGETSEAVAVRLRDLARGRQVICISHLAPLAAVADIHLAVEKTVQGGRTSSRVRRLNDAERVVELSRMLGGGEAARGLAEAFLLRAVAPGTDGTKSRRRGRGGGARP